MKFRFFLVAAAMTVIGAVSLGAQTASEIVGRMSEEMSKSDAQGSAMTFAVKIPMVGEVSSYVMSLGDKTKMEMSGKDKDVVVWLDADTKWEYDLSAGEVVITAKEASSSDSSRQSDISRFENISEGYKLLLNKEDDEAWYITCRKKSSNKNKDDFKKMKVVVAKDTYLPLELSGGNCLFKISITDFALGVSDAEVTFRAADYPGVKITDNRM